MRLEKFLSVANKNGYGNREFTAVLQPLRNRQLAPD